MAAGPGTPLAMAELDCKDWLGVSRLAPALDSEPTLHELSNGQAKRTKEPERRRHSSLRLHSWSFRGVALFRDWAITSDLLAVTTFTGPRRPTQNSRIHQGPSSTTRARMVRIQMVAEEPHRTRKHHGKKLSRTRHPPADEKSETVTLTLPRPVSLQLERCIQRWPRESRRAGA